MTKTKVGYSVNNNTQVGYSIGGEVITKPMDELFLEYEAELEAKSIAYEASPQAAIDNARMAAKFKIENERRQAWEDNLTPEQWQHHFGEDKDEDE